MARERNNKEKHKHKDKHKAVAKAPPAQRKSSKSPKPSKPSKGHKSSSNAAHHSIKEPAGVKKPSKSKQPVNIAGVFKKSRYDDKKYRKQKQRSPTPEPDLADEFRDGIEEARTAIDTELKTSFETVHASFLHKLSESRTRDMAFFESMHVTANFLSAPLGEEQIETTFHRDGKRVTEIVDIGKRIEQFKKSVEKDEMKLKGYWKQWEDLQGEFLELGVEIFGAEAFGEKEEGGGKGFRMEMELLDLEHNAKVQELTEEVEGIPEKMLEKMKESEKKLDASTKQQQAQLLQALIAD